MTPRRQVNQPRPRCCPMCDHGGFRRVLDHYLHQLRTRMDPLARVGNRSPDSDPVSAE